MIYLFPKTRFAQTNTLIDQLGHIFSEATEVRKTIDNSEPAQRTTEEIIDLWHSIETYIRILEEKHGTKAVLDAIDQVVKKNDQRGYYQPETPTIQTEDE